MLRARVERDYRAHKFNLKPIIMSKKVTVTLTRLYKKELNFNVPQELLKGKSDEEIGSFLTEDYNYHEKEDLLKYQELEEVDFPDTDGNIFNTDSDRFDIYDENGKHIYGGHL